MTAVRTREPIVSRRLREARLAAGISQRQLGVLAGMDPSVASPRVNQYERGKHLPDLLTLERLGLVLRCPLPYFYTADNNLAELVLTFWRAMPADRERLARVAQAVAKRAKSDEG